MYYRLVLPYWADFNIGKSGAGSHIWFRETKDTGILDRATNDVKNAFECSPDFKVLHSHITQNLDKYIVLMICIIRSYNDTYSDNNSITTRSATATPNMPLVALPGEGYLLCPIVNRIFYTFNLFMSQIVQKITMQFTFVLKILIKIFI